jgi:hypothetical protein
LILSYVPDAEQRGRTLTRAKQQLTRDKVRLQSQMESLLEECQIKLSSVVSDVGQKKPSNFQHRRVAISPGLPGDHGGRESPPRDRLCSPADTAASRRTVAGRLS